MVEIDTICGIVFFSYASIFAIMNEQAIAVISGGTKGIGKALVDQFLSQGFKVFTSARSTESMVDGDLDIFQADLSKKDEAKAFADHIRSKTDHINVLVNNVGTYIPGSLTEEEDGVFETQLNTNLASTYHLTRGVIDLVKKAEKPYIFNICSTASITPYINGGSYCISKYAQLGLTKVLREEMKQHRVRVSAVMPGATLTSSWEGTDLPKERFIYPQSVAQLIWAAYQLPDHSVMEEILVRPMEGDIV